MTDSGYGRRGDPDNFGDRAADGRSQEDTGYVVRVLAQATLPHSRPENQWRFRRQNGDLRLTLIGQEDPEDPDRPYGLPYGSVPRLLLAWLSGEYKRTREREIHLGSSQREFLRALGIDGSGGARGGVQRVRWQLSRLISTAISSTPTPPQRTRVEVVGGDIMPKGLVQDEWRQRFHGTLSIVDPADESTLWWQPHPAREVFRGRLVLSRDFAAALDASAVPVDLRTLRQLARSPLAMDFYVWLTHRLPRLHEPKTIKWKEIKLQFGAEYGRHAAAARSSLEELKQRHPAQDHSDHERWVVRLEKQALRHFRFEARAALFSVVKVYPGAHFQVQDEGLRIAPSLPHVKRRKRANAES